MKRYTEDHEWIDLAGDIATVGITAHAQEQLGDITFVELPEVGRTLAKGDAFAVVESVKAASDVYAPLDGEVTEVNAALDENPQLVNEAAEEGGWFAKIKLSDAAAVDALMDKAAYDAFLAKS
ncbi:glycine cleavage system protein GcvH [Acuticoccus sp. MNP-M23]|uniref:glycine cleavage system protein GcvH n=1 Tax=Acuticoccus sp. MNP-M23 TaxID=3072793 RepID=UPI00281616A0|nr:glycine cleavage system protein GcvH [Acuticoccus sp. MNP-M23]WMS42968.1 glycine cleavage system protein GcvH [Acuticoccus sp. MNP-M23]